MILTLDVYSIRLIIRNTNTSYTFNENLIETNFGQFSLKTKINNKLRWINKKDSVSVLNHLVNQTSTIREGMPIITPTSNKTIHDNNFVKLSAITNCNLNSNYVKLATSTSITLPLETNVIETVT